MSLFVEVIRMNSGLVALARRSFRQLLHLNHDFLQDNRPLRPGNRRLRVERIKRFFVFGSTGDPSMRPAFVIATIDCRASLFNLVRVGELPGERRFRRLRRRGSFRFIARSIITVVSWYVTPSSGRKKPGCLLLTIPACASVSIAIRTVPRVA